MFSSAPSAEYKACLSLISLLLAVLCQHSHLSLIPPMGQKGSCVLLLPSLCLSLLRLWSLAFGTLCFALRVFLLWCHLLLEAPECESVLEHVNESLFVLTQYYGRNGLFLKPVLS